jgi:hypothetical protein
MREGDPSLPFELMRFTQRELERRGYYFFPIPREHTEGLVTEPMAARLRGQVKKRGFAKVAGHTVLTYSGYDADPREVYAIPEIRAYTRQLDVQVPELPALLAFLPALRYNGPGLYLMLLGEVADSILYPERGGYDVRVAGAPTLIEQALRRIREAAVRYHLSPNDRLRLEQDFLAGTRFRLARPG